MSKRKNAKTLGDICQNCVIGELSKYGIGVAFPLSDNYRFDFIAITNDRKLFKIQVKGSTTHKYGSVLFYLSSNNWQTGEKYNYNETQCDVIIGYDLSEHKTYIFSPKDFSDKSSISIRLVPKNTLSTSNDKDDFIISEKRIKEVFGQDIVHMDLFSEMTEAAKIHKICCKQCEKDFQSVDKNAIFCSDKCSYFSRRKAIRPTKEELEKLVWEKPTVKIAKELDVSDITIGKWCKQYGIQKPPRGYWAKKYANDILVSKGKQRNPTGPNILQNSTVEF